MGAFNIGVLGTGSLTRKNAVALLKDATTNQADVNVFVAAQHFTEAARYAADYATDADGVTLWVYDNGTKVDFDAGDYPDAKFTQSDDVVGAVVKASSTILYAYDEAEPPEQEPEITRALRAKVTVLDLCGGLFALELGPDDDGGASDPVPDEGQQAPVAPSVLAVPPLQPVPVSGEARLEELGKELAPFHAEQIKSAAANLLEVYGDYAAAEAPVTRARALVALDGAANVLKRLM